MGNQLTGEIFYCRSISRLGALAKKLLKDPNLEVSTDQFDASNAQVRVEKIRQTTRKISNCAINVNAWCWRIYLNANLLRFQWRI